MVDIDKKRLDLASKSVKKIVEASGKNWTVEASSRIAEDPAPGTRTTSSTRSRSPACRRSKLDNDIPLKYGIDQCIGDTIGPGGLFKAMRTIPVWLEILRDAEKLCPNAQVLNYTNPMCMITLAGLRATSMRIVGLCHSVQGTGHRPGEGRRRAVRGDGLSSAAASTTWRGSPNSSTTARTSTRSAKTLPEERGLRGRPRSLGHHEPLRVLRHRDQRPLQRVRALLPQAAGTDQEALPQGLSRRDGLLPEQLARRPRQARRAPQEASSAASEPIEFEKSVEYASVIVEAMETGVPAVIHGNVVNTGLIDNLLQGGCVEVACLVTRNGLTPTKFGELARAGGRPVPGEHERLRTGRAGGTQRGQGRHLPRDDARPADGRRARRPARSAR